MKRIIILSFTAMSLLTSCGPSKIIIKSTNSVNAQIDAGQSSLILRPLMADMTINNIRKEVNYTGSIKLSKIDLKNNALSLFLKTHSCDYVVDPIFETIITEENRKPKEITIKVSGMGAKYTKIYQVDSLPKSVFQTPTINSLSKRIDFLNSIDETEPNVGVEIVFGSYFGVQVDALLSGGKSRVYGSLEKYNDGKASFKADFYPDTISKAEIFNSTGSISLNTASLGLMKEFPANSFLKFRLNGGLNFSQYTFEKSQIASNAVSFNEISSLGIRLGGGFDVNVFKNIFLITKAHSNINFLNVILKDKPEGKSLDIKNIEFNDLPFLNIGIGLRVVF